MEKMYVLVDPLHDYAPRFVAAIAERHGYRPLCVTTERTSARQLRKHPALHGFQHAHVRSQDLEAFGRRLGAEQEVLGAIPFAESVLNPVVSLLRGLGSTSH